MGQIGKLSPNLVTLVASHVVRGSKIQTSATAAAAARSIENHLSVIPRCVQLRDLKGGCLDGKERERERERERVRVWECERVNDCLQIDLC